MRSKFIVPLLLILSILLIAGFFLLSPTYIHNNGNLKHFEDNDMSFDLLGTWTVYEYDDALKTPFLSSSPSSLLMNPGNSSQYSYTLSDASEESVVNTSSTNAYDVVIVKTEMTKYTSLPEGFNLDNAYQSDSLYALMNGTGQFDLVSSETLTVGGHEARQFVYEVTMTTYQDTWVEVNGHYYRFLSQAPSGVFSDAQKQFNTTLNSLQFK